MNESFLPSLVAQLPFEHLSGELRFTAMPFGISIYPERSADQQPKVQCFVADTFANQNAPVYVLALNLGMRNGSWSFELPCRYGDSYGRINNLAASEAAVSTLLFEWGNVPGQFLTDFVTSIEKWIAAQPVPRRSPIAVLQGKKAPPFPPPLIDYLLALAASHLGRCGDAVTYGTRYWRTLSVHENEQRVAIRKLLDANRV